MEEHQPDNLTYQTAIPDPLPSIKAGFTFAGWRWGNTKCFSYPSSQYAMQLCAVY